MAQYQIKSPDGKSFVVVPLPEIPPDTLVEVTQWLEQKDELIEHLFEILIEMIWLSSDKNITVRQAGRLVNQVEEIRKKYHNIKRRDESDA